MRISDLSHAETFDVDLRIVGPPRNVAKLSMSGAFSVYVQKMPNRFHRFMAGLLLGWRWEELQ